MSELRSGKVTKVFSTQRPRQEVFLTSEACIVNDDSPFSKSTSSLKAGSVGFFRKETDYDTEVWGERFGGFADGSLLASREVTSVLQIPDYPDPVNRAFKSGDFTISWDNTGHFVWRFEGGSWNDKYVDLNIREVWLSPEFCLVTSTEAPGNVARSMLIDRKTQVAKWIGRYWRMVSGPRGFLWSSKTLSDGKTTTRIYRQREGSPIASVSGDWDLAYVDPEKRVFLGILREKPLRGHSLLSMQNGRKQILAKNVQTAVSDRWEAVWLWEWPYWQPMSSDVE
ncbi:hypothetical protein EON81_14605 [bacterium]|nr:MAG: hypothetical protein EON81_14605 [bacterium]